MRADEFTAGQPQDGLSEDDKKVLDFAGRTYRYPGKQHEDILTEFGYSPTTFYQRLSGLLSSPHALAYAPQTVRRHQRIVDTRLRKSGHSPRYSD